MSSCMYSDESKHSLSRQYTPRRFPILPELFFPLEKSLTFDFRCATEVEDGAWLGPTNYRPAYRKDTSLRTYSCTE